MFKKVCRWLTIGLPLALVLPLFLTNWSYFWENSEFDPKTYGLFDSFNGWEFLAWGDSFHKIWMTLFAVFVVLSLIIGLGMAIIFLLNNLKVGNFQKYEKIAVIAFSVVFALGFIFGTIATIVNVVEISGLINAINGEIGFYIFMIVGLLTTVSGLLAIFLKSKTEKEV